VTSTGSSSLALAASRNKLSMTYSLLGSRFGKRPANVYALTSRDLFDVTNGKLKPGFATELVICEMDAVIVAQDDIGSDHVNGFLELGNKLIQCF
jgi:hypothetical protein